MKSFNNTRALYIALVVSIILLFCSCSASKKSKTSETRKSDSTATVVNSNTAVHNLDTGNIHRSESDFGLVADITFENIKDSGVNNIEDYSNSSSPAEDYFSNNIVPKTKGSTSKPKTYTTTISGNTVTSNQPISNIKLSLNGHDLTTDISRAKTHDSTVSNDSSNTHVTASDTKKTKNKETSGTNWFTWVGVAAVIILLAYLGVHFGWWAMLFKRNKSSNNNA